MLKNMKMGTKVMSALGVMIVMVAIPTFIGVIQIGGLNEGLGVISGTRIPQLKMLCELIEQYDYVARSARNLALADDGAIKKKQEEQFLQYKSAISESLIGLEKSLIGAKERELLGRLKADVAALWPLYEKILALGKANRNAEAAEVIVSELSPVQRKMLESLNNFKNFAVEAAQGDARGGVQASATGRTLMLVLGGVALICGVILSFLFRRNVAGVIKGLIDETKNLVGAAVEGKLATRGSLDKVNFEFRGIIEGVNQTLDAVIGPLNVSAEYIDRISKGDIPDRITDEYKGDFNEIKNNLNNCIDNINALVADVDTLSKAAVEGRLNTRADAGRHQGDYRKIVDGVNKTIARLVGFLDSMPTPAMIVDKDMMVLYINDIGAKVGGRTPQQITGLKCYEHFKTSDCNTERCACRRTIRDNLPSSSETDAHPCVGVDLEISYSAIPIKDDQGNVIGALEIVADQTAVKKAARLASKVSDYQALETAKVVEALNKLSLGNTEIRLVTAEGDDDTKIAKETFDSIANAVSTCVGVVQTLVADAGMLSKAALEGRLATRADASKHQGDFRKILEGVNETLDAVVGPLNVSAEYIDRIGKGDIPKKSPMNTREISTKSRIISTIASIMSKPWWLMSTCSLRPPSKATWPYAQTQSDTAGTSARLWKG